MRAIMVRSDGKEWYCFWVAAALLPPACFAQQPAPNALQSAPVYAGPLPPAYGAFAGPEPSPSPVGSGVPLYAGPQPVPVYQYSQAAPPPSVGTVGSGTPHAVAPPPPRLPTDPAQSASLAAWNILSQARQLVRAGRAQEALPAIQQFIAAKPLEPEGYFWQGVALDNLNRSDEALRSYQYGIEQVLKAGLDSAELRMNAGNVLLKEGKVGDAVVQYRRAAEIDPSLPLAQLNLGRALTESGDTQGALRCFARCDELHFQPNQLAYYRAKALLRAGRRDDARAQVETLLAKIPQGHEVAKKIKQEFAELLQNRQ